MTVVIKDTDPGWENASTIEEWMKKAIEEGKEAEVIALMQVMPLERRIKYRNIWREIKGKKNASLG